jgi:GNAT superfamily N-acetyltransferase
MSAQEFSVSPYDHAAHKPALLSFLSAVYEPDVLARRERVLDWVHDFHPMRDRAPLRHVIMDGDSVAATMGHLPAEYVINGRVTPARFTHDLLVDPKYRGQGLAKLIVGHALDCGEFMPGGMWMTTACYKIHVNNGFDDATGLVTRTLVLDPDAFTARKGLAGLKRRISRSALTLLRSRALARARKTTRGNTAPYTIDAAGRFEPELDETWRDMLQTYGAGMARSAEYLNWKYARHPLLKYDIRLARRAGGTAGYVVYRPALERDDEKRAIIADFLVENEDTKTFEFMIAHAIFEAVEGGAEVLSVLTTQPWAARALRRFGFLPRGESQTWAVGGWRDRVPEGWLDDQSRWHVCMGDSDGDLWSASV